MVNKPKETGRGGENDIDKKRAEVKNLINDDVKQKMLNTFPLASSVDQHILSSDDDSGQLDRDDTAEQKMDILFLASDINATLGRIESGKDVIQISNSVCNMLGEDLIARVVNLCRYIDDSNIIPLLKNDGGKHLTFGIESDFRNKLKDGILRMVGSRADYTGDDCMGALLSTDENDKRLSTYCLFKNAGEADMEKITGLMTSDNLPEALARYKLLIDLQKEIILQSIQIDSTEQLRDMLLFRIKDQLNFMFNPIGQQFTSINTLNMGDGNIFDPLEGDEKNDLRRITHGLQLLGYYLKGIETLKQVNGFFK